MPLTLEKLRSADLAQYKALIDEAFGGSEDLTTYQAKYQENGPYTIVAAKDGARVVGSVTFYRIDLFTFAFQPALEIFNLAVLKEYRGQKIAEQLFDHVIAFAKEHGYRSLYVNCLEGAHAAHKLYENLGFVRDSAIKFSLQLGA